MKKYSIEHYLILFCIVATVVVLGVQLTQPEEAPTQYVHVLTGELTTDPYMAIPLDSLTMTQRRLFTYEQYGTIENMIEWVTWDIEEGRVDSITGAGYINNLSKCLDYE